MRTQHRRQLGRSLLVDGVGEEVPKLGPHLRPGQIELAERCPDPVVSDESGTVGLIGEEREDDEWDAVDNRLRYWSW